MSTRNAFCLRFSVFCLLALSCVAALGPLASAAYATGGREAAPHSVARTGSGTVAAWGDNSSGQLNVPAGLRGVVAVSAGGDHSLALRADGTIIAWGNNTHGQATVPAGLSGVIVVSAGGSHSLALTASVTVGTPLASPKSVTVGLNTPKAFTLTGTDPDVPALPLTYSVATSPAHSTLSGTAPNLTYTPNNGYHGDDGFYFLVNNGFRNRFARVTLRDAAGTPTADAQTVIVHFNTATAITLTGSDPDVPALPLTYSVATSPAHGTLAGTVPNLTYTPTAGYVGTDAFTFKVSNGTNTSSAATVSLTVNPVFLASLTFLTFLTPVPGGTVLSGTVTLSGITPTDVVVGLSSSNSATIRLHRAVIVLAGSSSATFEIDTYRSHVTKTVTITANLNATTLTRDLTISGR